VSRVVDESRKSVKQGEASKPISIESNRIPEDGMETENEAQIRREGGSR
jgi:hypothetical protein